MRILRSVDYRRMPWKNGKGETVEIAVFPPDASVDSFDWRISMATVATDGPFSIFPGIDRTLSVLDGHGMALEIDGEAAILLTQDSAPLPFAADVPVMAHLENGPITDLNVMTRRGRFTHRVERVVFSGRYSLPPQDDAAGGMTMVMVSGPASIAGEALDARDTVIPGNTAEPPVFEAAQAITLYYVRLSAGPER